MVRAFGISVGLALAVAACAPSYDPAGSSSDELSDGQQNAGYVLTETQVEALLMRAGFSGASVPRMVCIAKYSSGLNPLEIRSKSNGSWDVGLFMINTVHVGNTPGCPKTSNALFDLTANTQCARAVFEMHGVKGWPAYAENRVECENYRIDRTVAPAPASTIPAPVSTR
jgi:hypothetical protein